MAEAFLKVVLDNLGSLIMEEIGLILGVDEEMHKISSTLTTLQAVLEDAEDKQIESRPIRDWLQKLSVHAYENDEISATLMSPNSNTCSKLSRLNLKKILYRHKIGRRMKQVRNWRVLLQSALNFIFVRFLLIGLEKLLSHVRRVPY